MDGMAEQQQLFQSCRVLFGTQLRLSNEFLEYLQLSGLKGAYRQRARETHPDALPAGNGLQPGPEDNERFHRVRTAYEQLFSYIKTKESRRLKAAPSSPAPPPTRPCAARPTARPTPMTGQAGWRPDFSPSENLYCGPLPQRRLLFGHFLYYSGLANWRTISRILTWQRSERPRLGELGHRFGMLQPTDIHLILREKAPSQRFGQAARDLGMLNDQQVQRLLRHQQRLQKQFGTILLEKNLVDRFELHQLLDQFDRHNAQVVDPLRRDR